MESETWFHVLVTVYLLWHGIWWSKSSGLNLAIKMIFWIFGIWGIILTLKDFGLVVQI